MALFLFQEAAMFLLSYLTGYSMQLVSACIASVAKGDAKLIGLGALGFPILMEAHMC